MGRLVANKVVFLHFHCTEKSARNKKKSLIAVTSFESIARKQAQTRNRFREQYKPAYAINHCEIQKQTAQFRKSDHHQLQSVPVRQLSFQLNHAM